MEGIGEEEGRGTWVGMYNEEKIVFSFLKKHKTIKNTAFKGWTMKYYSCSYE